MQVGEVWAYREKPRDIGWPVLKVEIVQLGPRGVQKLRVRFLEGEYPGLDLWVPKVRLRVPWSEADAWLRDERLLDACWDVSFQAHKTVEHRATWFAIGACRTDDGPVLDYETWDGTVIHVEGVDRVAKDLGLDLDELHNEPLSFVNRHGTYVAPWPVLFRIGRRTAEVHPDRVLAVVVEKESELRDGAARGRTVDSLIKKGERVYLPPEHYAAELEEQEPVFALVREWCGRDVVERFGEVAALRAEVARLRKLAAEAARRLEITGNRYEARRLYEQLGLEPTKPSATRRLRRRASRAVD